MSSQDRVERVLKDIHIAFAKSEPYGSDPDKIIVDRKYFLELIDRLNHGIYDMLEEYEHTRQSRDSAERAFRKKGEQIISDASSQADDVYAASMLYTADMIGRIRELMDRTNDSMNDLFREFRRDLRAQKDVLKKHETELEGQLSDLADTKKYLSVLEDINLERRRRERGSEEEKGTAWKHSGGVYTPPSAADVKVNEQFFEKSGTKMPGQKPDPGAAAEKPDIIVNTDAAYFKWKASQDKGNGEAESAADEPAADPVPKKEDPVPEKEDGSAEFPDEETIMQAVLADELAAQQEEDEKNGAGHSGSLLKRLFFGN